MANMKLEDFDNKKLSVEDFTAVKPKGFMVNSNTASQLAATDTILRNGDIGQYSSTKEDIQNPERREAFLRGKMIFDNYLKDSIRSSAINMVSDTTLGDEERFNAFMIANQEDIPIDSGTLQLLAEEASLAPSGENETEETAEVRTTLTDFIPKSIENKRRLLSRINSMEIMKDQTALDKIADVGEILIPFAEWIHYDQLRKDLGIELEGSQLLGEVKKSIFDSVENMSLDERQQATETLIQIVEENENVILPDGNDLLVLETLQRTLIDNDYSDAERWFDNMTSILEVVGLGAAVRSVVKTPSAIKKVKKARDLVKNSGNADFKNGAKVTEVEELQVPGDSTFRTETKPTAPQEVVKDVNPDEARKMHKIVLEDETGEAATALKGTNKADALSDDLLPENGAAKTPVRDKPNLETTQYSEPENIRKTRLRDGVTQVSDAEWDTIKTRLTAGFENIRGMTFKTESVRIGENLDGTLSVTAMYSPVDSGFKSVERARELIDIELKKYGLPEDAISLYERVGEHWARVNDKDLMAKKTLRDQFTKRKKRIPDELKELDYRVGVDYNYRFRPEDLEISGVLTTGNSITRALDSMSTQWLAKHGQGSVVQNLFDPGSVIHPQIVNTAAVAVDKALGIKKAYVDEFESFTKGYKKLPTPRRAMMNEYIHKANEEGIPLRTTDLLNRGFNEKEISLLHKWRKANDAMWYAANDDMIKTLRSQNFHMFVHKDTDTKFFGRPVGLQTAKSTKEVYDPVTEAVVKTGEVEKLYDNGGTFVKLSEPVEIDGKWIDTIMSRNTPQGGYVKAIPDGEAVLPYRDGYYPVMYDANYFIEKTVKNPDGTSFKKVVASATNLEDAKIMQKQIMDTEGLTSDQITTRKDRRLDRQKIELFDEGSWSLATNSGLTAQKRRGKRLGDASVNLHHSGKGQLKDPLEAVANQINTLSQRVAMRDVLNTFKERWLQSYENVVELKKDNIKDKFNFPTSADQIVGKVGASPKSVADARTNFNYIYALENGYINGIDEAYKAVLHSAANFFAEKGWRGLESASFKAAKGSPIQNAKTMAFRLFLSANPLRQGIIQRGQILQIGAINPSYMATGRLTADLIGVRMAKVGLPVSPRYARLWDEIKNAGIIEAVDAHTLIRDDALRLADLTVREKLKTYANAPITGLQKVGFDQAEQDVLLTSWLAHRDMAKKAGKNLESQRVQDEILGQSRAFTLNMNRSGEMAYSQNTLGLVTQFLSFSHKAMLQGLTNKSLSKWDRAKLTAYTTAVFGVDATLVTGMLNLLWEENNLPSDMKDDVEAGLLDVALNQALTEMSGKEQAIDFGDLAPVEAYGFGNMFFGLLTSPIGDVLKESPGGSLFFGNNPRVTDAIKTGLRYFYEPMDYQHPQLNTNYKDVGKAFMQLFSGASNIFKARYAYEMRRKISSKGKVTDEDITELEAIATAFGFRTKDEVGMQAFNEAWFKDQSYTQNDIDIWYNELKRHLTRRGGDARETEFNQMVLAEAWTVFGEDRPKVINRIASKIENDAKVQDYTVMEGLISKMGIWTEEETLKMINKLPDGNVRDRMIEQINYSKEMVNGGE